MGVQQHAHSRLSLGESVLTLDWWEPSRGPRAIVACIGNGDADNGMLLFTRAKNGFVGQDDIKTKSAVVRNLLSEGKYITECGTLGSYELMYLPEEEHFMNHQETQCAVNHTIVDADLQNDTLALLSEVGSIHCFNLDRVDVAQQTIEASMFGPVRALRMRENAMLVAAGSLALLDPRTRKNTVLSLQDPILSGFTSVIPVMENPHHVAAGTGTGHVAIWDLRLRESPLLVTHPVSFAVSSMAHTTGLRGESLMVTSMAGELAHVCISPAGMNVPALLGTQKPSIDTETVESAPVTCVARRGQEVMWGTATGMVTATSL